jgi:hypothetical protein
MSAVISDCGLYRYRLDRDCEPFMRLAPAEVLKAPTFAYFGINPSTADAELDDATVRKWRGFTERNGGGHLIVGNVFSYRATDVKELDRANRRHVDLLGPDHVKNIEQIIAEADVLVPCWGRISKVDHNLRPCFDVLERMLLASLKPVMTFGRNSDGSPRHPLMLGYSTQLEPWGAR